MIKHLIFATLQATQLFFYIMQRIILFIFLFLSVQLSFSMTHKINWDKSVDQAIAKYAVKTEPQLIHLFQKAKVAYPPQEIALLAFKQEQTIQLWAKNTHQTWKYIHTYPLTAFSGRLGPKLKERDYQIPEGLYRATTLNPFSSMHLSIMLDYPNHFDRLQASKDGRRNLGSNIFVHGKSLSVGCLAIGDQAIEQIFLLARKVGLNHTQIIIAPNDLRQAKPATHSFAQPRWLPELYQQIAKALEQFPLENKSRAHNWG